MESNKLESTPSPPPNPFKDCWLLTKEHFNTEKYVPDRDSYGLVSGEEVTKKRVTAVYFSASWCPPCQKFTPLLKQMYEDLRNRNAPLQVIFVSFDRTKEMMKEYFLNCHGDWLAVPYDDPQREQLADKFNINAIPKLVVLRPDGEVITMRGRKDVQDKGMICFRSWQSAASLADNVSLRRTFSETRGFTETRLDGETDE
ncbi:nucleoredoxin-like protein 2 [Haliotis asinina]|uniref:nucleoredoxin-like protein 2 n=1 Tax=Haliotis asinina TaxID=109174 RepID=UPI003531F6E1